VDADASSLRRALLEAGGRLAGAGALAAALFLIKLRPPRILIPSLSLWQRVLDASPDVTRWEKIRRAVSLIVTVLIAVHFWRIRKDGGISGPL